MGTDNADKNKARILIVDDALENRLLLTDILADVGYSVDQASSGDQALSSAEANLPDLILLDVMMPDRDGYEVCRLLKVNERTSDIPVIFVSALNNMDDQVRGFAVGGVDYIVRPFRSKEVLARVETHLTLQSLRRNLEEHVQERTRQMQKANARLQEEIAEREQAERELERERNLLRTLIDAVPDYIFVKDRDGRFILTNVAHAAASGMAPDDLIGKIAAEVFPGEVATQFHSDDESVMVSGQPLINEDRVTIDQDGHRKYVLTTKIPLRNTQGEVIGLVGVSRDITERHLAQKALQESELRYKKLYNRAVQQAQFTESLLGNMPVGVLLMTPKRQIMEANQELRRMTGYAEDELQGQGISRILVEDPDQQANAFFQRVEAGVAEGHCETSIVRKDGSQVSVRIRAARLADGEGTLVGILSTIEDLTQIEIMEEARREADTLRIELEKEKELGDLKSRFVSMVSHEFRTPLATIQATVDSLHNYHDRMSPDQRAKRFQKIRDQIERATTLLDDVLTIQRMETKAEEFTPTLIDLNQFLEEYIERFRSDGQNQEIMYSCQDKDHCMIMADRTLLQQIVSSLVSNAVSYSADAEPVQINVSRGSDNTVVLQVSDQGIGIPEEEQKYLFANFFRGSNTTGIPGSGLGLAVAKHAVDRHGGTITFESAVNVGTKFVVTLPAQQLG